MKVIITMVLVLLLGWVPLGESDQHHPQVYNKTSSMHYSEHGEPPPISICGSCKMREEIKHRNLELIKSQLLEKLGLKLAPNITGKVLPRVPEHFLAMVNELEVGGISRGGATAGAFSATNGMQSDQPVNFKPGFTVTEEDDDFHSKTHKVLTFAQPYPRLRHGWRGHDILHFTFSDSILKYHVQNATLHFFVKGAERRPLPVIIIEIFKVFKTSDRPESPGLHRVYARKITQPLGRGEFIQVDLSDTVSEWFKSPRENFGFVVNATVNGRKVVVTDTTVDNGNKAPFLEISTMETRHRMRRFVRTCDEKSQEQSCCRYPMIVDFELFGWDFIIFPKRYNAYYCEGECEFLQNQRFPHTHIKQMASPNSAQPCCAPRRVSAISMLYFDEHYNVMLGSLPGMVVEKCGCS